MTKKSPKFNAEFKSGTTFDKNKVVSFLLVSASLSAHLTYHYVLGYEFLLKVKNSL